MRIFGDDHFGPGDQRAFFISAERLEEPGAASSVRVEPGLVLSDGRIAEHHPYSLYFSEEMVRETFRSALADGFAEQRAAQFLKRKQREKRAVGSKIGCVLVVVAGLVGLWLLVQAASQPRWFR